MDTLLLSDHCPDDIQTAGKILRRGGLVAIPTETVYGLAANALDGKVVVEARYQKVDIECNGTVHLTVIPGKVKTIKL